jgi:hypothetical protein
MYPPARELLIFLFPVASIWLSRGKQSLNIDIEHSRISREVWQGNGHNNQNFSDIKLLFAEFKSKTTS